MVIATFAVPIEANAAACSPTSSTSGANTILKFLTVTTCDWTVPTSVTSISVLLVAGGGGGGYDVSGGGGAGGLLYYGTETPKTPNGGAISVTPGNIHTIFVGGGGAGATNLLVPSNNETTGRGNNGGDTYLRLASGTQYTAIGGGGGNSRNRTIAAELGGSGGGGGYGNNATPRPSGGAGTGSGVTLQGYAGGKIVTGSVNGGAGGGGAGSVGTDWTDGDADASGKGGAGLAYSITGTSTFYGGGGGGGAWNAKGGSGGAGGGGDGGSQNASVCRSNCTDDTTARTGNSGTANTGGGGGGSGYATGSTPAGNGGSGILVISYVTPIPTYSSISTNTGSTLGGTSTVITGTNLTGTTSVTVGGASATLGTITSTTVAITTPAGTVGAKNIVITTSYGSVTGSSVFTYGLSPTYTSISVKSGSTVGGTSTVITGTNLTGTSGVTVGGTAATLGTITSTTVAITTPAGTVGARDIVITTPYGTATGSSAFTYITVSSSGGGTASTLVYQLTQANRTGTSLVYSSGYGRGVSDAAATLIANGNTFTRIRYRMEMKYSGVTKYADVTFDKPDALSTIASLAIPDIANSATIKTNVSNCVIDSDWTTAISGVASAVTTGSGKTCRLEIWPWNYGTEFTSGFTDGSSSTYDYNDASSGANAYGSFQVHNITDTQTIMAWNNHAQGAATDLGFGSRATSHPDWTFAGVGNFDKTTWKLQVYVDASGPIINSITVNSGSTLGGTSTVISGSSFSGVTGVTIGGTAATIASSTSSTISITTPVGTVGSKDVVVTTSSGTSTASSLYTYVSALVLTATTQSLLVTSGKIAYDTVTATSGTTPISFTLTGNGPAAITIDTQTANTAVLIVGISTTSGVYTETITATDASSISSTIVITVTVAQAISLSATNASINKAYGVAATETITATLGTGNKTLTLVNLTGETNISIDTSTANRAVLRVGANATTGTYSVSINAVDSVSATASLSITISVSTASAITITAGTPSAFTYSPSGISLTNSYTASGLLAGDTVTAITYQYGVDTATTSATIPTNVGTYYIVPSAVTLTDSHQSNYAGINYVSGVLTINRAEDSGFMSYSTAEAIVGNSYSLYVAGGSGTGTVTYLVTGGTASGCAITGSILIATSAGTCIVQFTRAQSANYNAKSSNVTITFRTYEVLTAAPTTSDGSSHGIVISGGGTPWSKNATASPTITSFTPSSGPVGTTITITGTGLNGVTVVRLNFEDMTSVTGVSPTSVTAVVQSAATSGPIYIENSYGADFNFAGFTVTP